MFLNQSLLGIIFARFFTFFVFLMTSLSPAKTSSGRNLVNDDSALW